MDAGDPHDYVVVCSYHFTMTAGRHSLLAFFGRRDSQACYDWVRLSSTVHAILLTAALASAWRFHL